MSADAPSGSFLIGSDPQSTHSRSPIETGRLPVNERRKRKVVSEGISSPMSMGRPFRRRTFLVRCIFVVGRGSYQQRVFEARKLNATIIQLLWKWMSCGGTNYAVEHRWIPYTSYFHAIDGSPRVYCRLLSPYAHMKPSFGIYQHVQATSQITSCLGCSMQSLGRLVRRYELSIEDRRTDPSSLHVIPCSSLGLVPTH